MSLLNSFPPAKVRASILDLMLDQLDFGLTPLFMIFMLF